MFEPKKCHYGDILSNIIEKLLAWVSLRLKIYWKSQVKKKIKRSRNPVISIRFMNLYSHLQHLYSHLQHLYSHLKHLHARSFVDLINLCMLYVGNLVNQCRVLYLGCVLLGDLIK